MDKNITAKYILDRFDPTDKIALVVIDRMPTPHNVTQRITTAERAASPEYQKWLRYENAQHRDVYIGMNPLREDAHGRMKEDIREVKHVYLDFDAGGAKLVNDMMGVNEESKPRYEMPIPHAIVNTSPGKYQTIWNVENFSQLQAEWLMGRAAREFGADIAATDSSRVLRLPGLYNYKPVFAEIPGPAAFVTVQSRDGRALTPGDFPAFPERELPARVAGVRRQLGSGISQSEKDFAFACGELEKRVSPAQVIAALELRRPDKPNPAYYARHTVESAQRKVQSRDTISR